MQKRVFKLPLPSPSTTVYEALSSLMSKHEIVRDLGSLDSAEPIFEMKGVEKPGNFLVRYLSIPWDEAKSFIVQILLSMTKGTLFVEVAPCFHSFYCSPSGILREIREEVRKHSYALSSHVRVVVLIRTVFIEHMGRKIAIPQFIELEKIHLEMELSSCCGVGFIEQEALKLASEVICLEKAILSRRSVVSLLPEQAQWPVPLVYSCIQKVHLLESIYLSNPECVMENSEFLKLLEFFFPL